MRFLRKRCLITGASKAIHLTLIELCSFNVSQRTKGNLKDENFFNIDFYTFLNDNWSEYCCDMFTFVAFAGSWIWIVL